MESKFGKIVGIFIGIYVVISVLCLYVPKKVIMSVDKAYWTSNIDIEKYKVYHRADVILPINAKLIKVQQEVIGYEDELYDYEYTGDKKNIDGVVYYEKKPIYRKVPKYAQMYYYDIGEWIVDRSIEKIGVDGTPYYEEVTLCSDEQIKDKSIDYYVEGNAVFKEYYLGDNVTKKLKLHIDATDLEEIKSANKIEMWVLGDKVLKWKSLGEKDFI